MSKLIIAGFLALAVGLFVWWLEVMLPNSSLWIATFLLSGAIIFACIAGLMAAKQQSSITGPVGPIIGALVFGALVPAAAAFLSIPHSSPTPIVSSPSVDTPIVKPVHKKERTDHSERPRPMADGRFAILLKLQSPFPLERPTVEISNVSDSTIFIEKVTLEMDLNGFDIVDDRHESFVLRPHASQKIRSNDVLDTSFVDKDEKTDVYIFVDIDYGISDRKYDNVLRQGFACNYYLNKLNCPSISHSDRVR